MLKLLGCGVIFAPEPRNTFCRPCTVPARVTESCPAAPTPGVRLATNASGLLLPCMGCAVGGGVACVAVIGLTGALVPESAVVVGLRALVGSVEVGGITRPLGCVCINPPAVGSIGLAFS